MKRVLSLAALAFLLAGCATPPAVYELADKTSSNAGVLQGHLATLSSQSGKLAQARVDNILVMQAEVTRLDAELRREMYMRQQSMSVADWDVASKLLERIAALRDELVRIEASAAFAPEQRRKELLEGHKNLDTHKAALRDAATALSSLAERESKQEQAKFLAGFAKAVRADFKKAVESGDQNAVNAQKLIDKVSDTIKKEADTVSDQKVQGEKLMAIDLARLALLDKLFLVIEAIRVVRLALNDAPTPDDKLDLEEDLSDLQDLKSELMARRNQLAAGDIVLPPPSPEAMNEIQALTQKVQQAALDGTAVNARLAVVSQVLGITITLLS